MKKYLILIEHLPGTMLCIILMINFGDFSFFYCFLCLFFGWLIDIDHLFDYFFFKINNKRRFSFNEFLESKYFIINKKIIIPLHAFEISLIFLICWIFFDQINFVFILLSFILHLIHDQLTNKVRLFSYFLTYRALIGFNIKKICK